MTEPERISEQDLERHERMLTRIRESQQLSQQAQQLQARANELAAAFKIWAEELHERYHLDANRGEGVHEDGTILRPGDATTAQPRTTPPELPSQPA